MPDLHTADDVLAALQTHADPGELPTVRRRLAPDEPAIGMRMRDVFATAKAAAALPDREIVTLLADPRYEARLAAFCVLDVRARRPRATADERRTLYELYLGHHDRITTWDMVDRAAPSVVGGYLLGRPADPLVELAGSADPLRRRTAITAPLWFVRYGDPGDLGPLFTVAALLAGDPDPVVHRAVGIALKHAGGRDPHTVRAFLDDHGPRLPRPVARDAAAKL